MIIRTNLPNYIEHKGIEFNNVADFIESDFWKFYLKELNSVFILKQSLSYPTDYYVLYGSLKKFNKEFKFRLAHIYLDEYQQTEPIENYLNSIINENKLK